MRSFGARLRLSRKLVGMTREKLAAGVKVHIATVGRWERNEETPNFHTGCRVAKFLGVATYFLAGIVDDPTPGTQLTPAEAKFLARSRAMSEEEKNQWRALCAGFDQTRRIASKSRG